MQPISQVSNEFILRILINQAKIERTLLAPTRSRADELLRGIHGGGLCLTADLWRVNRYKFVPPSFGYSWITQFHPSDGGGQSQPMQSLRRNDHRNLFFTDQNPETQLRFVFANPQYCVQVHLSPFS